MQTHEQALPPTLPMTGAFFVSDAAATRINHLKIQEDKPNLYFRITVKGGGCSGFQYEFALDDSPVADNDTIITMNGAKVAIDDISLNIIAGSTLDYSEDLSQAGFEIKNPKATARCGCGNSFSVAL